MLSNTLTREMPSGVAGYLAPWGKKYSCPPSTKLPEFELKNRCKSAEEAKAEHFCSYLVLF